MFRGRSLVQLLAGFAKQGKNTKHDGKKDLEVGKEKGVETVESRWTPLSISLKSTLMFVPAAVLLPFSFLVPPHIQQPLSNVINLTILLPSLGTNYLNLKHPFTHPQYNAFYRLWFFSSTISSIAIPFALNSYPYLATSSLLLINLVSSLVEYQLRMEDANEIQYLQEKYEVEGEAVQEGKQARKKEQKYNPMVFNKNYYTLFVYRCGVIGLLILNLALVFKNDYVKGLMEQDEEEKKKMIEEVKVLGL